MSNYNTEFKMSYERSKRFLLEVPEIEICEEEHFITPAFLEDFPYIIYGNTSIRSPSDLSLQCLSANIILRDVISDYLRCPVYYTIGWIDDFTDKGMFKFDDNFIQEHLNARIGTSGSINIHAWLTLPSMEVIDATVATSIAQVKGLKDDLGGVLANYADDHTGFRFKPMLIGEDFLRKSGALTET